MSKHEDDTHYDELKDKEPFLPAPATQRDEPQHPISLIISVITFYFIISISVVFLNKSIMSGFDFPYPLFIVWYQFVVALALMFICPHLTSIHPIFSIFPRYEFNWTIAKKVAPLAVIYVLMLAMNQLCLLYVQITFYQIARSLAINFSILFSYLILGKKTSPRALFACFVIFVGFAIGSYGEIEFSWLGLIYGVLSSAFGSLYGIYIQKTLPAVENNEKVLQQYNTTLAIFMLGVVIFFSGEMTGIMSNVEFLYDFNFWFVMTFTGITGFAINIAMFLQVKYTSALSNTISGTAKACVQTILAAMIYRNPISVLNGFGLILAIFGTGYYAWIKYLERIGR